MNRPRLSAFDMLTYDADETASPQREAISFGPFRLVISERRLETAGGPVTLGGRAFDILIFLVERAGEIVSKRELLDRVWPDVTVQESSLRVQIAALRRALSDNRAEDRYVATIAGRGYCFVAPITRSLPNRLPTRTQIPDGTDTLPPALKRMVGRIDVVEKVPQSLLGDRFLTIVAPGVGKTTVAVWIAHTVLPQFEGAAYVFDLGPSRDPQRVPSASRGQRPSPVGGRRRSKPGR